MHASATLEGGLRGGRRWRRYAVPALADGHAAGTPGTVRGRRVSGAFAPAPKATGTIEVRFDIEHVHPGQRWQLFLSDNGARIFAGTRTADGDGEFRAIKVTTNRPGADQHQGQRRERHRRRFVPGRRQSDDGPGTLVPL